jgi:hypothetical protein
VAAQDRICQIGIERRLELIDEVTGGDPPKDLPVSVTQPWVPRSASPATLLQQLLTDAHRHIVPRPVLRRSTNPIAMTPQRSGVGQVSGAVTKDLTNNLTT